MQWRDLPLQSQTLQREHFIYRVVHSLHVNAPSIQDGAHPHLFACLRSEKSECQYVSDQDLPLFLPLGYAHKPCRTGRIHGRVMARLTSTVLHHTAKNYCRSPLLGNSDMLLDHPETWTCWGPQGEQTYEEPTRDQAL